MGEGGAADLELAGRLVPVEVPGLQASDHDWTERMGLDRLSPWWLPQPLALRLGSVNASLDRLADQLGG